MNRIYKYLFYACLIVNSVSLAMDKSPAKREWFIAYDKNKLTALMRAVLNQDEQEVQKLLNDTRYRRTIDLQDGQGFTALHQAVIEIKFEKIFKLLIEAKANIDIPNFQNYNVWQSACTWGASDNVLQLLLNNKADLEDQLRHGTPLLMAANANRPLVVQFLIKSGANLNAIGFNSANIKSLSRCNELFIKTNMKVLQKYGDNRTDEQMIKDRKKLQEIVDDALAKQAEQAKSVAVNNVSVPTPTPAPISPVKDAAKSEDKQEPKEKEPKDKVEVDKNNQTPLMKACRTSNESEVTQLLKDPKHKAAINAQDIVKETALHSASRLGNEVIVTLLLNHNADPHVLNHNKMSPVDCAIDSNHFNVVKILLNVYAMNSDNYKNLANCVRARRDRIISDVNYREFLLLFKRNVTPTIESVLQENLRIQILIDEQADKGGLLKDADKLVLLRNKHSLQEARLKAAISTSAKRECKTNIKKLQEAINALQQKMQAEQPHAVVKTPSVPSASPVPVVKAPEVKAPKDDVAPVAAAAAAVEVAAPVVEVTAPAGDAKKSVKVMAMMPIAVAVKAENKADDNRLSEMKQELQTVKQKLSNKQKNSKNKKKLKDREHELEAMIATWQSVGGNPMQAPDSVKSAVTKDEEDEDEDICAPSGAPGGL